MAVPILLATAIVAIVFQLIGLPGGAIVFIGIIAAGFTFQAPQFKASEKSEPHVLRSQMRHRFWRLWATKSLWIPTGWQAPKVQRQDTWWRTVVSFAGNAMKIQYSTIFSAVIGLLFGALPQMHNDAVSTVLIRHLGFSHDTVPVLHAINALSVTLVLIGLAYARRQTVDPQDISPGVTIAHTVASFSSAPHAVIAPAVLGAIAAIAMSPGVMGFSLWNSGITLLLCLVTGVALGVYPGSRKLSMTHWRKVVKARNDWDERFRSLKQDPPPRLDDLTELGAEECPITIYHFTSNVQIKGSEAALKMGDQIAATIGGSASIAVVPVEQEDSYGNARPGSVNALCFDVVEIENPENMPSITDPETDDETVEVLFRAMFAWASDESAMRMMPLGHHIVTDAQSPVRVFEVDFIGAAPTDVADLVAGGASRVGVTALGDHRANNREGALYVGLFDEAIYSEQSVLNETKVEQLLGEQWWNQVFTEAMKQGANPPRPEWATLNTQLTAEGVEIQELAFIMRKGHTLEGNFFPIESQIATSLPEYQFVSIVGFHNRQASRPAERHRQAFTIRKSIQPVPSSIEDIRPATSSKAPEWVLAALVNRGFADSKLARPELISARAMSTLHSTTHLWQLRIRLYGGVTLADIRRKANQLRSIWSVDYLRVREDLEGVRIVAGAHPDRIDLTPQARSTIDEMEWEQIFTDAGIKSDSGAMPRLLSSEPVEGNDKISIKTFSLQGTGLSLDSFTARRNKLESISANFFVQPQVSATQDPSKIELVISKSDPMPFPALVDYDVIDQVDDAYPFATGLYGEPVLWRPSTNPHALFSGLTGSGKSIVLQNVIFAALLQGHHVYVMDPTKGGVDFGFAKAYIAAMTGDVYESAAIMRYIYDEIKRRKDLVASYGVEKLANLPSEIRPPRILVVLDEFTSLMEQEKPPPKSGNHEAEMAREEMMRLNSQKQVIGEMTGKIAREARSVEITLMLGTQKLSSAVLDGIPGAGDLKTNLARSVLGPTTLAERQVALRSPYDAPSIGDNLAPGRGLWEPVTAARAEIIQSWFEPGGQEELRSRLAQRIDVWPEEDRPDWRKFIYQVDNITEVQHIEVDSSMPVERELGEVNFDLTF